MMAGLELRVLHRDGEGVLQWRMRALTVEMPPLWRFLGEPKVELVHSEWKDVPHVWENDNAA